MSAAGFCGLPQSEKLAARLLAVNLFLASFLHPLLPDFLGDRVAYIGDAARTMPGAPFAIEERAFVQGSCRELVDLPVATTPLDEV